jgi:tRNA(fMet)-specific endonuclease VapC
MAAIGRLALDTSVIVAALRRHPGIIDYLRTADELWVPLFALGELEYGASRASHPERQREAINTFMLGAVLLLPSKDTAVEYGRLKAQLARAGTPIPENDIWIAAQAIENQLLLATLDAHFDHIPGLSRPDWTDRFRP